MNQHIKSFLDQNESWDCSFNVSSFLLVVIDLSKDLDLDPIFVFEKMAE